MVWRPNVTVAAIVERDAQFLIVEERAEHGCVLNQPAGHLESGESLIDALVRETLEETGWHVAPTALIGIYRYRPAPASLTYLRFCFSADCTHHEPMRVLDNGIIAIHWLSAAQLRTQRERLRSPMVLRCIDDYLDGRRYPLNMLSDIEA